MIRSLDQQLAEVHDRRVAAEALRSAAVALDETDPVETALSGLSYPVAWLKNRADEIEMGG